MSVDDLGVALAEARRRYDDAHPVSRRLHERACRVLPGGNTRTVLHIEPFPFKVVGATGAVIDYVSSFVLKQIGEHYDPHVSTEVAPKDYLDKMVAEPFEAFTFSPAGSAVYQMGPYGTAAKKLKEWD